MVEAMQNALFYMYGVDKLSKYYFIIENNKNTVIV